MNGIELRIDISGAAGALPGDLPRKTVNEAAAIAVRNLFIRNFRRKENGGGNSKGFPRSHYWAQAASATRLVDVTDEKAVVEIDHPGVALHARGGVVRPFRAKSLAIPLRPEVYGANPREGTISGLFVIASKKSGRALLAGKGEDGKARIYWLLLKSARVRADPSTLPSDDDLAAAAREGAANAVAAWTATSGERQ